VVVLRQSTASTSALDHVREYAQKNRAALVDVTTISKPYSAKFENAAGFIHVGPRGDELLAGVQGACERLLPSPIASHRS
jgi:hypothetical protein